MQNFFAWFLIVRGIALQHLVHGERVFERYERLFRLFLCADKENERLLLSKTLIVLHPPYTMVHEFAFADKVCRRFCNDADKSAPFVVLQRRILLGYFGKFLFKLLLLACFFDCLLFCVLLRA